MVRYPQHFTPMQSEATDRERPADVVIGIFGIRELARHFKKAPSTIWRWTKPKPRGTAGLIPSEYQAPLLDLAEERGRTEITAEVLIRGR